MTSDSPERPARILAILPNWRDAIPLNPDLAALAGADLVVADSTEAALEAIDAEVPDLVLIPPFMAVDREDHLIAYLRTFSDAAHVQIIRMPFVPGPVAARRRSGLFRLLRKRRTAAPAVTYDPRPFAADAVHYLAQARTMREDLAWRRSEGLPPPAGERRAFERKPRVEIPSVAAVRLASEPLDLIDLSAGGARVRSRLRPGAPTLRRYDARDVERIITLRMTSGEEVEVPGSIARWRLDRAGLERVYEVAFRFDTALALFLPRRLQRRNHQDLVPSSIAQP